MKDFGQFLRAHEADLAKHPMPERMDESEPLISNAKALAEKWGLKAPWAPAKIIWEANINYSPNMVYPHEGLSPDFKDYRFPLNAMCVISPVPPPDERRVKLDMEYDPSRETRASARDNVIKEFERQAAIIERRFEAKGMVPLPNRWELATHVRWLYLSICPDPKTGRPCRFNEIATREQFGDIGVYEPAVRKAVNQLAKKLEISLPNRLGRPRKTELLSGESKVKHTSPKVS
jgi:hypothetical protein